MKLAIIVLGTIFLAGCCVEVSNDPIVLEPIDPDSVRPSDSVISKESIQDLLDGKSSFMIGHNSFSRTGGSDRDPDLYVKVQLGAVPKGELSVEEKINALKERTHFYELALLTKIDLKARVSRSYSEVTLSEILEDLAPNLDVEFEDYDDSLIIHRLNIRDAEMEYVLSHIDDAAKARFTFRENKLFVSKE